MADWPAAIDLRRRVLAYSQALSALLARPTTFIVPLPLEAVLHLLVSVFEVDGTVVVRHPIRLLAYPDLT